jgi:hypothetical protein
MAEPTAAPTPQPKPSLGARLTLPEPIAAVLLLVIACGCASVLLAMPRPHAPDELPNLSLPEAEVQKVIASDEHDARDAPKTARAQALQALLLKHGRTESEGLEEAESYKQRRTALAEAYAALAAEVGESKALKLRSQAVQQLEQALALKLPAADATALLGAFPNVLAREHVTRDGLVVAPEFVVRTLFKARWNLLCGLQPAHAFAPVERRAFFGWQALHAERVAVPHRIDALEIYAKVGGTDTDEALGVLMLRSGNPREAERAFESAYRKTGSLRLRNALLAARIAAKPRN